MLPLARLPTLLPSLRRVSRHLAWTPRPLHAAPQLPVQFFATAQLSVDPWPPRREPGEAKKALAELEQRVASLLLLTFKHFVASLS